MQTASGQDHTRAAVPSRRGAWDTRPPPVSRDGNVERENCTMYYTIFLTILPPVPGLKRARLRPRREGQGKACEGGREPSSNPRRAADACGNKDGPISPSWARRTRGAGSLRTAPYGTRDRAFPGADGAAPSPCFAHGFSVSARTFSGGGKQPRCAPPHGILLCPCFGKEENENMPLFYPVRGCLLVAPGCPQGYRG